jgi:hypothetical protein
MRTSILRAASVALLVAAFGLAVVPSAAAGPATAFLRLAHLSPDTPPVDVTVAGVSDPAQHLEVPGVGYGAMSDYAMLAPGQYTVSMRGAGAPPDSPPVLTTTFAVAAGEAVTVAGLGNHADVALRVLRDDLTPPPAGQAKVRIINASPTTPSLNVRLSGGQVVVDDVPYAGATDYRRMPIGSWRVEIGAPGSPGAELPVKFAANAVYTVLLVNRNGALAADIRTDGVGATATPSGSVSAGYGGAAANPVTVGAPVAAMLLGAGLLAASAGSAMVRRRSIARD